MLPVPEGVEKPTRQTVELSGVVDPAMRSELFILLMDGMEGFKRRDVIDLKLNRIPQEAAEEEDEGDEAAGDEKPAQAASSHAAEPAAKVAIIAARNTVLIMCCSPDIPINVPTEVSRVDSKSHARSRADSGQF